MRRSVRGTVLFLASEYCPLRMPGLTVANFMPSPRLEKFVLPLTLTIALAAYGMDCLGMTRPEQAMQCCSTMHCHLHGHRSHHSQDCCITTPQMHAALGQPSLVQGVLFLPVALGVLKSFNDSHFMDCSVSTISGHSHDPPRSRSTLTTPLRV